MTLTEHVTAETAQRLKEAGFPEPEQPRHQAPPNLPALPQPPSRQPRETATYWQQHVQRDPHQRQRWQQQSNQQHSATTGTRWPTGQQRPRQQRQPATTDGIGAVFIYILFFALVIYVFFK